MLLHVAVKKRIHSVYQVTHCNNKAKTGHLQKRKQLLVFKLPLKSCSVWVALFSGQGCKYHIKYDTCTEIGASITVMKKHKILYQLYLSLNAGKSVLEVLTRTHQFANLMHYVNVSVLTKFLPKFSVFT